MGDPSGQGLQLVAVRDWISERHVGGTFQGLLQFCFETPMWHDAGQTSELHKLVVFACFWKLGKAHVSPLEKNSAWMPRGECK